MNKPLFAVWSAVWLILLLISVLMIPGILVKKLNSAFPAAASSTSTASISAPNAAKEKPQMQVPATREPAIIIPVYRSKQQAVEHIPLESYVAGVVAGEMPIQFPMEALKAQAIASRTYVIHKMLSQDFSNVPRGAWVSDTKDDQVYDSPAQLKEAWGKDYNKNMKKLDAVIAETKGKVITYQNKPIQAEFFSTSNGYTENSEDYWGVYIPYLRSVPSPWDKQISPKYKTTVAMSDLEMARKLDLHSAVQVSSGQFDMKVLSMTAGHRVKILRVGDQVLTGKYAREKLGLTSSGFTWVRQGKNIQFTAYGYGHGVGMSQYGACGMAEEGKTAEQILIYYYRGVRIEPLANIANLL